MVDNMVHRLSQSTTASRELVNNPVIDYVPDASNEKGVRDEVLRESDGSDGSQEHGIASEVDFNECDHSDGDYVEDGQNVPFDEPPMPGVVFKEDRDDVKVSCRSKWDFVALATTRQDGCDKIQRCLNGRFKLRSGNNRKMYYHCTSHEDCKCCYRVSYCKEKASWVVGKRDYADHESGVLPNVIPKTKVCKLVPIDGEGEASDEGVRVERNIKDGPFRGIPSDIKEKIWKLHTSHELSGKELRHHLLTELGGDKERLPEARQITVRNGYTQTLTQINACNKNSK